MNAPGFWEILTLAVLALLIFGPDKLPEIARKTGQVIGRLRAETASTMDELRRAAEYEDFRSVAGELKATSADVRQTMAAGGGAASAGAGARTTTPRVSAAALAAAPDVVRPTPAPFDPDAT